MVVVGQVDFQANQLSWLYLPQIGANVCVCERKVWGWRMCAYTWRWDGNLICVFWARRIRRNPWGAFVSRTFLAPHHFPPHPVQNVSQTLCTEIQDRPLYFSFTLEIIENPDPWGQIVARISTLQNFVESIHQHVAESIRCCLIHFLRKIEGLDEEEIHYLVVLLVFGE